jgi:hypothetical protein
MDQEYDYNNARNEFYGYFLNMRPILNYWYQRISMNGCRLIEIMVIAVIVTLTVPTLLVISGDIQTTAEPAIAENGFSVLFILRNEHLLFTSIIVFQ